MQYTRETVYPAAVEILEDFGHESSVYEDYSGRGMYGKTVVGISTYATGMKVAQAISEALIQIIPKDEFDREEFIDLMEKLIPERQDQLGLGRIFY